MHKTKNYKRRQINSNDGITYLINLEILLIVNKNNFAHLIKATNLHSKMISLKESQIKLFKIYKIKVMKLFKMLHIIYLNLIS